MDKLELQNKLSRIPGVIGANIAISNDEINEVHVLADDSRKAKEIMLDTKSLLSVELQQPIDFRIISVAQISKEEALQKRKNPGQLPRLLLLAAYIKRTSGNGYEGVVELKLEDRDIIGKAPSSNGREGVAEAVTRALCNALGELMPSYTFRAKIMSAYEYIIAEVVTLRNSTNEPEELVGAVKASGDPPWDAAKAILSALNRRLGYLILDEVHSA